MALVGASGGGKSSLVRAGVIPRLREQCRMVFPLLTPGPNPVRVMAGVLAEAGGRVETAATVLRRLRQGRYGPGPQPLASAGGVWCQRRGCPRIHRRRT